MANSISGKALAGSTISLTGTATATTTAGPTGLWSFSGLAAGPYTITPTKLGIKFTPALSNQTIVVTDITGVNFLGQPVGSQGSTYTIQNIVDRVYSFADIEPVLNVGGFSLEPALTIANDVFNEICATPFPHKWNSGQLPLFYVNSWQQDYALIHPDGSSVYEFEWLEKGVAINISSTQFPKPWVRVECGRALPQRTGTYMINGGTGLGDPGFIIASYPNSELYYGTWGQPNTLSSTWGNNPVAGSVFVGPTATTSMPSNPITQIIDSNGNLLLLTGYGTEGANAPTAAIGALPGTQVTGATRGDASTTIWTVVDPNGLGVRMINVPSQTGVVWQFTINGQFVPPKFTSLDQVLNPLPDKYEPFFRAGFIAQCYRYSPEAKIRAKFDKEWPMWQKSLSNMREAQDRELEEWSFVTERTVMGSGRSRNTFKGAAWPFNYPIVN
jgi:hypothetical protein